MWPSIARRDDARRATAAVAILPVVVAILLLIAYPFAVHGSLGARYPWLAGSVATLLLGILAFRATPAPWRVPACIAVGLIAGVASAFGRGAGLPYLPPILINLGLAAVFAATLRTGHEPMISRFARLERGTLEPDLVRYTRALTRVWVLFFVGMAALSAALAALPSVAAWQWFTILGNWLAVAALYLGEWVYRRLRFAHYRHASPLRLLALVRDLWRA